MGAHEGRGLSRLADHIDTCEEFIMVEPSPRCIDRIKAKLVTRTTERPTIILVEGVLGKKAGVVQFYDMPEADQSGNLFGPRRDHGRVETITIPMAQFGPLGRFDLAKINIEGMSTA